MSSGDCWDADIFSTLGCLRALIFFFVDQNYPMTFHSLFMSSYEVGSYWSTKDRGIKDGRGLGKKVRRTSQLLGQGQLCCTCFTCLKIQAGRPRLDGDRGEEGKNGWEWGGLLQGQMHIVCCSNLDRIQSRCEGMDTCEPPSRLCLFVLSQVWKDCRGNQSQGTWTLQSPLWRVNSPGAVWKDYQFKHNRVREWSHSEDVWKKTRLYDWNFTRITSKSADLRVSVSSAPKVKYTQGLPRAEANYISKFSATSPQPPGVLRLLHLWLLSGV